MFDCVTDLIIVYETKRKGARRLIPGTEGKKGWLDLDFDDKLFHGNKDKTLLLFALSPVLSLLFCHLAPRVKL